jgi:hypothetical protein
MAVDDELAWEPRLPWVQPKNLRWRLSRGRPSAQPIPERFEIVVPDLLVNLTFDPVLGPNPRTRYLTLRPKQVSTIFDPVSHLSPIVWEPTLPTGTRRSRRERRREVNQASVDPPNAGVIAAQRMTWMPHLPTRTRRWPLRRRETGASWWLLQTLVPTPPDETATQQTWMPTLPPRTSRWPLRRRGTGVYYEVEPSVLVRAFTCTTFSSEAMSTAGFSGEVLTSPGLLTEQVTSPGFINEDLC